MANKDLENSNDEKDLADGLKDMSIEFSSYTQKLKWLNEKVQWDKLNFKDFIKWKEENTRSEIAKKFVHCYFLIIWWWIILILFYNPIMIKFFCEKSACNDVLIPISEFVSTIAAIVWTPLWFVVWYYFKSSEGK